MRYLPALDGMRGIAILMVIGVHAHLPFASGGFIGVDLFFVLSGYLITTLLLQEHEKYNQINLKRFYWRRCIRLIPAIVVLLIFSIIISLFLPYTQKVLRDVVIVLFYGANWARAFYGIPAKWLGHTWSLSIEEQYYFVWPFALLLITKFMNNNKIKYLTILIVAVSIYRYILMQYNVSLYRIYFGSDTRLDAILVGCVLSFLMYEINKINDIKVVLHDYKKYIDIGTICSIAYILYILVSFRMDMLWFYSYGMLLVAVASAVIILNIITNPEGYLARLLSIKGLTFTGKISYGIYIWHWPVFYYLHENTKYNTGNKFMLGIFFSYAIAMLSFWLVEQPLLKHRNRF